MLVAFHSIGSFLLLYFLLLLLPSTRDSNRQTATRHSPPSSMPCRAGSSFDSPVPAIHMAKLPQSSFALDFLRRLLCANSSDGGDIALRHGEDAPAAVFRGNEEGTSPARSPCIVARLMGLDAMPTPPRDHHQPTLRRSRSASSAEGLSPPPPTPCCSPRPRVARTTSASFSDRPTYLRRENDEFLLLSFSPHDDDDDDLSAGFSPASRTHADSSAERSKQRREHRRRRHGEPSRSRRQAAAAECGMENSSPVSVLEARDAQEESSTTTTTSSSSSVEEVEQTEHCSHTSDGGEIRTAPSQLQGSRRKLTQAPFDDHGSGLHPEAPSTSRASNCSGREGRDRRAMNNAEANAPAATGMWRIICRLVEDDVCGMKWGGRGDGNISAEMESAILDQLICEETDELMQLNVV